MAGLGLKVWGGLGAVLRKDKDSWGGWGGKKREL